VPISQAGAQYGLAAAAGEPWRPTGRATADLLARVPLFEGLSKRHLRRVAGLAERASFVPGRRVVAEGAAGDAFYVILDGRARVVRGASGRALTRLGPGDHFGELALLDGGPRLASVVAETELETIRLPRKAFCGLMRDEPDVALKVMEAMARLVRELRGDLLG
jgi:CRP-like cAMP-binding protein